jgi:hypothetical protein
MPFSGSGSFSRVHDWTTDEGNGVNITASRMDAEDDGFATGLSTCMTKDGQTATTAVVPFAFGVSMSDGLVATPAIRWTSDTNTGFYRIGADNLGLALGGVLGVSWSGTAGTSVVATNAGTNAVVNLLTLTNQSTGTPAAGIGTGIALACETSASNNETGAVIEAVVTDATAASEDFDLVFKVMQAGAAADEKFRITSTDTLKQTIGSTSYTVATPLVLFAEAASGSVATIDIKDLPAGTKKLEIRVLAVQPATDAQDLFLRLSTDNGATFLAGANDYGWALLDSGGGVVASSEDGVDTEILLATNLDNADDECWGTIEVTFKATGRTTVKSEMCYIDTSPAFGSSRSHGYTNNACNAVQLLMTAGNINVTYSVIAYVG